jgi:hypothetical protein
VIQTLAIPRGQIAMASGTTMADATSFELVAKRESTAYGICSNPFLEHAFTTVEYRIKVDIHADGTGATTRTRSCSSAARTNRSTTRTATC